MDLAEDLVDVLVFLRQKPRFACASAGLRVGVLVFLVCGHQKTRPLWGRVSWCCVVGWDYFQQLAV